MKIRAMLPVVLLLFSLISMFSSFTMAQQTTTVSINPSTTSTTIESDITVNLQVTNVQNLGGWNLNLTWNPQVINLTQISEGTFLADSGTTLFTWSPRSSPISRSHGYIQGVADVLLSTTGVSGSGVLATITFYALGSGTSPISIAGTTIINPPSNGEAKTISATITSGTVNVEGSSTSPTATASQSPESTPTPTHPTTSASASTSPTQTNGSSNPSQNPDQHVPEFPTLVIIIPLLFLASAGGIMVLRKAKLILSK
jgi:hypothetical protein